MDVWLWHNSRLLSLRLFDICHPHFISFWPAFTFPTPGHIHTGAYLLWKLLTDLPKFCLLIREMENLLFGYRNSIVNMHYAHQIVTKQAFRPPETSSTAMCFSITKFNSSNDFQNSTDTMDLPEVTKNCFELFLDPVITSGHSVNLCKYQKGGSSSAWMKWDTTRVRHTE